MSARVIQELDAGGRKIELIGQAAGEPEFYVEGVHGLQLSGTAIKMNLYTLGIDSSPTHQRRESVCRVVMGAPQFLQFADFVAQVAAELKKPRQAQPSNPALPE